MKKILLFLLTFCSLAAEANQDVFLFTTSRYENIFVSFCVDKDSSKVIITIELLRKLFRERKYSDNIHIEFLEDIHNSKQGIRYGLSYLDHDSDSFKYRYPEGFNKGVNLIVYSSNIKPQEVLNIVDYSMQNIEYIKDNQKILESDEYTDYYKKSIDRAKIEQLALQSSAMSLEILKNKIYAPVSGRSTYEYTYYFRDSLFYFFSRTSSEKEDVILKLKEFKRFKIFRDWEGVVFVNDSSFYYLNENELSPLQIITGVESCSLISFEKIGWNKFSVSFFCRQERSCIYYIKEKKLIQDMDQEFNKPPVVLIENKPDTFLLSILVLIIFFLLFFIYFRK